MQKRRRWNRVLLGVILFLSVVMTVQDVESGEIIYVDDDGGEGVYTSISAAIAAANPGDTIMVSPGTYNEHIWINKPLTIIGADKETTIIDGSGLNQVGVEIINTNHVDFSGFTIQNAETEGGLWITQTAGQSSNNTIHDNIIRNNEGIGLHIRTHENTIQDNILYGNTQGIACVSYNNNIFNNLIYNHVDVGVLVSTSTGVDNQITENIINNNGNHGIRLEYTSNFNTISRNTIMNNSNDGVNLKLSNDNSIKSNIIKKNGINGLQLDDFSDNNFISANQIIDNGQTGILINQKSSYNTIVANMITDHPAVGINIIGESHSNILFHNNFIDNTLNANDLSINSWYKSTNNEGNFWSDHSGNDGDGDGIIDMPYPLPFSAGVKDNFPFLMISGWNEPISPNPEINASGILQNIVLSWSGGALHPGYDLTYNVYFGPTNPPTQVIWNQEETTYTPGSLAYETTHYWKITTSDILGVDMGGDIWHFTTIEDPESEGGQPGDDPPSISNITHTPHTITENDIIQIQATVIEDHTLTNVELYWYDSMDHIHRLISMTMIGANTYSGEIGPFSTGVNVTYWIQATDNASQTTQSDTYTFTITDNTAPIITIHNPLHNSTIYNTKPTIQASYTDQSDIVLDSIILTFDSDLVTEVSNMTSTTIIYIPENDLNIGQHGIKLELSDSHGNTAQTQWFFTIAESTSSTEIDICNITTDQQTEILPSDGETNIFIGINITSYVNLSNVTVIFINLEDKPENIQAIQNEKITIFTYAGVEILADNIYITEGSFKSLRLTFKVQKTWFEENQIDTNSILLMRYHNSTWQNLTTTQVGEDAAYYYFEAETPGLSTFAIVGNQILEVQPYDTMVPEIPWTLIILVVIFSSIILIIVLFKGKYTYRDEEE